MTVHRARLGLTCFTDCTAIDFLKNIRPITNSWTRNRGLATLHSAYTPDSVEYHLKYNVHCLTAKILLCAPSRIRFAPLNKCVASSIANASMLVLGNVSTLPITRPTLSRHLCMVAELLLIYCLVP
ncbi:hypothetical protein J6590_096926 [Homalodisca vitripennis]|nr:hypothetical protein J6590_096926 [Homalodisca vitripennis]